MKTYTVTKQEGELLGPVDWEYNFQQHDWTSGGSMNPECLKECIERLRTLTEGGRYEATTDGGYPKFGWGKVLEIGMYDGWPFWKPVPSVLIESWSGASWHWFGAITAIRAIK